MRKPTPVVKSSNELRSQLLQQANSVTELFKDTEYANDFADEIVVVLDKCTDKTKEIAQKFTNKIIEGYHE